MKRADFKNEVYRVIKRNSFQFVKIGEVLGRCYVMRSSRYEVYEPVGIPDKHIYICNKTFHGRDNYITDDSDLKKPFNENVDMVKAFKKRDERKCLKRMSNDSD